MPKDPDDTTQIAFNGINGLKNWLPGMDSNHDYNKPRTIYNLRSFTWSKMPD
jgi:hypothetical protein